MGTLSLALPGLSASASLEEARPPEEGCAARACLGPTALLAGGWLCASARLGLVTDLCSDVFLGVSVMVMFGEN